MYSTPAPPPVRRPVPSTGYHILRPVSLALRAAPVVYSLPFSSPPTRDTQSVTPRAHTA